MTSWYFKIWASQSVLLYEDKNYFWYTYKNLRPRYWMKNRMKDASINSSDTSQPFSDQSTHGHWVGLNNSWFSLNMSLIVTIQWTRFFSSWPTIYSPSAKRFLHGVCLHIQRTNAYGSTARRRILHNILAESLFEAKLAQECEAYRIGLNATGGLAIDGWN